MIRGFTRDKILFLSSLTVIVALICLSVFSAQSEAKAGNANSAETLVISDVICENGKVFRLKIDEKVTENALQIDEKYICLKDSLGAIIPLDTENAEVNTENAIIIHFKDENVFERLENSSLTLNKGFKVSERGKSLSCDVVWTAENHDDPNKSFRYNVKVNFKYNGDTNLALYVGETKKLNYTCNPDPKCFGGKWQSSSKKVLTIEDGVIKAVGVGSAQIRCSFFRDGEYFITVNVKESNFHQSESTESPEESPSSETGESLPESRGEPESEAEIESEFMSEFESESESEPESQSEYESVSVSESEGKSESESATEQESEFESESVSERDSETESESEYGSENESESEFYSETISERCSETISESEEESEKDSGKESETCSDESSMNESSSEEESETGKESESGEADSGSSEIRESDKTVESNEIYESDKTDESGISGGSGISGESNKTPESFAGESNKTPDSSAGGSDNDGDTSLNATKKDGRKIALPLICGGAVIALGVSLAVMKGRSNKKNNK